MKTIKNPYEMISIADIKRQLLMKVETSLGDSGFIRKLLQRIGGYFKSKETNENGDSLSFI